MPNLRRELGDRVTCHADAYEAAEGADGLIICTEWNEFRSPDFDRLNEVMRRPLIFDGRNLYSPEAMRRRGFQYYSIGRPAAL